MVLEKESFVADGLADLYRAALYLARGSVKLGVSFLKKAYAKIPKEYTARSALEDLARRPEDSFIAAPSFWAEKILDEYQRLKINPSFKERKKSA